MLTLSEIEHRIEQADSSHDGTAPERQARLLLEAGETVIETWIIAKGEMPGRGQKEGFRLLALHRQGAKGDPSFNACRETCRELVYHYNLIAADAGNPETGKRLRLMRLVAKHLCLFVAGKLEVAGLGEFCCASKPLRGRGE